jgi:hypothetical protein
MFTISMPAREPEGRNVRAAAVAAARIIKSVGICLGVGDQLPDRNRRKVPSDRDDRISDRQRNDRLECIGVVWKVLVDQRAEDDRRIGGAEQGVAGGLRQCDNGRADAADRAGTIVNHDGMPERSAKLVGHHPAQRVGNAADRSGHHERDRSAGEIRCRRCLGAGRFGQGGGAGDRKGDRRHQGWIHVRP